MPLDDDLNLMTTERLKEEVIKLRNAIRNHRDSKGHDLCWYMPEMWSLLPEVCENLSPQVPNWCDFMQQCAAFRKSLDSIDPS